MTGNFTFTSKPEIYSMHSLKGCPMISRTINGITIVIPDKDTFRCMYLHEESLFKNRDDLPMGCIECDTPQTFIKMKQFLKGLPDD